MNRTLARILQAAVVVFAAGVLVFLLWEPHLEGRNAHASTFQVYFNDPFLAVAYLASIAFFVGCFQAFRALGDVASFGAPTARAARSFRIVRSCALILLAFVAAGEVAIFLEGDNG